MALKSVEMLQMTALIAKEQENQLQRVKATKEQFIQELNAIIQSIPEAEAKTMTVGEAKLLKISKLNSIDHSLTASVKSSANQENKKKRINRRSNSFTYNHYETPCPTAKTIDYGLITPKMKPNDPLVLVRQPREGEIAFSNRGSPLYVATMPSADCAKVNVPLKNGSHLCIQPQRGLRFSLLPKLEKEQTVQLKALRDNIQKILEKQL